MSIYAHIKRCLELSEKDIASAILDRRLAKALLDQLAKVSRPGDGAPKLLLVFARMATQSVDWIDGALRIEMVGDADVTVVEVLSELGLGMHERVFPSFKMGVPLDEFVRAVERVPHMIEPLTIATQSARRLVLTAIAEREEEDTDAGPSPEVSIGDDSLYVKRHVSRQMSAVKQESTPPQLQKRTVSSANMTAAPRKTSKPSMEAVKPKIISPTTGKTLRPAPMKRDPDAPPPPSVRALPKAPPLPRTDPKSEPKRAVVARVPLTKMPVPVQRGSRPPAAKVAAVAATRNSRPPPRATRPPPAGRRATTRPPPIPKSTRPPAMPAKPKPSTRPPKGPPPRSAPPPKSTRARDAASEPPDEESIDMGWDEKE